jgi:PAS domain S-box-containing protein
MFNELLREQVQKYWTKVEAVPAEWGAFLQEISDTYDDWEKEGGLKNKPIYGNDEAIRELNIKLRNEAEELKKAHAELGRILDSVNYGFFSRDTLIDNYIYLSLACERIYGYTAAEFFANNRLWYEVIYPEDRSVVETDNERLNNGEEVYTQYRIIRKDKSIRWVESTLIPSFAEDILIRIDGVINDITKRKEAETEREVMIKELVKTNADLKQFSYITSHNLRSPLSNIQGILNLFDLDEKDVHNQQLVKMLKVAAQQLHGTIDDLTQILIIKNSANPDAVCLNLEDSFTQVIQTFKSALDEIGGKVFADFKSPFVMLNKVFLESIFINLISNAIKYHSNKRTLIIQVESREDENGQLILKFTDNGIGIDLERHKAKIFGLYQRFHDNIEGKGLGLFIIKSQIEAAGGKIAIESKPDVGTTFILTLRR